MSRQKQIVTIRRYEYVRPASSSTRMQYTNIIIAVLFTIFIFIRANRKKYRNKNNIAIKYTITTKTEMNATSIKLVFRIILYSREILLLSVTIETIYNDTMDDTKTEYRKTSIFYFIKK